MTGLWRTWLTLWCWGVGIFGLVLAGAAFPPTDDVARILIDQMNATGAPVLLEAPLRFGLGLQGALSIGLALLVYAGARAATELGPRGRPIWNLIVIAMMAWYVIDSTISCATGFPLNALSNTLLIVAFLVPIIAGGVRRPGLVAA